MKKNRSRSKPTGSATLLETDLPFAGLWCGPARRMLVVAVGPKLNRISANYINILYECIYTNCIHLPATAPRFGVVKADFLRGCCHFYMYCSFQV